MRTLALFPLQTVLFPGVPLPLHIFEPRYRLMIRHCILHNEPFGVVLIRQGVEALGPLPEPYRIGCTASIVRLEHLPDGRMNLLAVGEERFRIFALDRSQPYLKAQVEVMPMEEPQTLSVVRSIHHLRAWVKAYLALIGRLTDETLDLSALSLPDDPLPMLYMAASLLQIPLVEKQDLLESETSAHLLHKITRLYRREMLLLWHIKSITSEQAERIAWLN